MILIMIEWNFLCEKKDFSKIEKKNNICIDVFCYENKLVFPIYVSDKKFENSMDLLLVTDRDISHFAYIKDFNRFMFHEKKLKTKKTFVIAVCSVLAVKMCQ